VSLRLLYLIFIRIVGWLVVLQGGQTKPEGGGIWNRWALRSGRVPG
jgi:hypothetical protein